jgi:MFS family permease
MVPILSGIIIGQGPRVTTRRAFMLSLAFVLAMAVTYTVAGVVVALLGHNLQATFQHPAVLIGFAAVFVALALAMFGFYELQVPAALQTRLTEASNRQQSGTLAGAGVMGFLSALIVGPCVAAPLAAALIVIGQSGDPVRGGGPEMASSARRQASFSEPNSSSLNRKSFLRMNSASSACRRSQIDRWAATKVLAAGALRAKVRVRRKCSRLRPSDSR